LYSTLHTQSLKTIVTLSFSFGICAKEIYINTQCLAIINNFCIIFSLVCISKLIDYIYNKYNKLLILTILNKRDFEKMSRWRYYCLIAIQI